MKYIHTKTREEYDQLMDIFEWKGWKWANGESIKEFDGYNEYGSDTIIANQDECIFGCIKNRQNKNRYLISFQGYLRQEGLDKTTFTRGEKVLLNDGGTKFSERIYLTEIEGAKYPYVCVGEGCDDKFLRGEPFSINFWKNIKKIEQPKTITLTLSVEDHEKIKGLLNI